MGFGSLTFRRGLESKDTGVKQAAWGHLPLLLNMHEVSPKAKGTLEIASEGAWG